MRCTFQSLHRVYALSAGLIALPLASAPANAQNGLPFRIEPPPGSVFFGGSVASGGDADGDGFDDVFVMDHAYEENGVVLGRSVMYSTRTQAEMWRVTGVQAFRTRWYLVGDFIGDIDGDGRDDVALGQASAGENHGRVDVYSGRTGTLLHSYPGEEPELMTGRDVAGVGDVNGDGTPDFAFVIAYAVDGRVSVRSGRDGTEILSIARQWPRRVRGAGDINGDGLADIAVGSWWSGGLGIAVYSGADGSIIHDFPRRHLKDSLFGWTLAAGRDLTGDGTPDIIASSGLGNDYRPIVLLIDGRTGAFRVLPLPSDIGGHGWLTGYAIRLGDVNADGSVDAIVGDQFANYVLDIASGKVLLISPPCLGDGWVYGTELAVGDVNSDGFADIITQEVIETGGVHIRAGAPILLSPGVPNFRRGSVVELVAYHGAPGRRVYFVGSRGTAACTYLPRLNLCLNLARPFEVAGHADTDADGFARLRLELFSAPQGDLWFQAVDPTDPQRGAIVSNLLEIDADG